MNDIDKEQSMEASNVPLSPTFQRTVRRRSSYAVRKEVIVRTVLSLIVYIALLRGTGMWYGLPAVFEEGNSVDPLPQKLMLYSLIPFILIYFFLEPHRFAAHFRRLPPTVFAVVLISIFSLGISITFGASFRGLAAVALLTVGPLLYRCRYGRVEMFNILTNFAICAAYANFAYTILFPQFAIMRGSYDGMVKGLFYHKNLMGHFFAVSFFLIFLNSRLKYKLSLSGCIKIGATLCTLVLVLVSKSSTAVVMLSIGITLIVAMSVLQGLRNVALRAFVIMFTSIGGGMIAATLYLTVAESIAESFGKDLSFSGRSDIWEQLIPLILNKPFLGYGFAAFRQPDVLAVFIHDTFNVGSVHSTYIELCLNIGIPGAVLWVAFVVSRLMRKMVNHEIDPALMKVQSTEIVIIVLVLVASAMDAGMMLAPIVLCTFLTVCLPIREETPRPRLRQQS